jgi:hypothetical protein
MPGAPQASAREQPADAEQEQRGRARLRDDGPDGERSAFCVLHGEDYYRRTLSNLDAPNPSIHSNAFPSR